MIDIEPVTLREIARRLYYSPRTLQGWAARPTQFFPPFPPSRWGTTEKLWDWTIVVAWYERTHRMQAIDMSLRKKQAA